MENMILNEQQKQIAKYILGKVDMHNKQLAETQQMGHYLQNEWNNFIVGCKGKLNVPPTGYVFSADKMAFVKEEKDVIEQKAGETK